MTMDSWLCILRVRRLTASAMPRVRKGSWRRCNEGVGNSRGASILVMPRFTRSRAANGRICSAAVSFSSTLGFSGAISQRLDSILVLEAIVVDELSVQHPVAHEKYRVDAILSVVKRGVVVGLPD